MAISGQAAACTALVFPSAATTTPLPLPSAVDRRPSLHAGPGARRADAAASAADCRGSESLPSTASVNPRARHRTKAVAGIVAAPQASGGGGAVLERAPAFDQSQLDTLPVTQEGGDPGRLRDGRRSGSGDSYKVLLVDDARHTEKHVEKALPQVVPSITAEAARQLFHESRLRGVAVVIVAVKEHAEFYAHMMVRQGLRSAIEPESPVLYRITLSPVVLERKKS